MKRRTVSGIILLLVLIGMLTLTLNIQPVKASATIYIRADGSIEPHTAPISSMDNITYTFTADIYDSIVVERDNIVLDGASFKLQGTGAYQSKGINLSNRVNVTIKNTRITTFHTGIYGYLSLYNNIWGNNIANNVDGISLGFSSGNNISSNNITTHIDNGIRLSNSVNNNIWGNNITAADWYGIYLVKSLINNISRNNIAKNVYGVWFDFFSDKNSICDNNITANEGYGIYISYFSNETSIWGNNIANNREGIILSNSSGNSILDNKIANNLDGLILSESCNNSISNNSITANHGYGICLAGHSFINNIWGNNITGTEWYGIYLSESAWNNISANSITANNRFGVYLDCSSRNNIWGNNIANNVDGIILCRYSYYNAISGNNITANKVYGIYLSYSSDNLWLRNRIYHNNFVDNTNQVYNKASVNIWDDGYPSGGNYWSDYVGVDVDGDGIGDTPYDIDASNQDRYPLIESWSSKSPTPPEALEELIETIETWNLPKGTKKGLTSKLEDARHLLDIGNENGAIHKLMDFISQVEASRGTKLTNNQADFLVFKAQRIIGLIKE